MHDLQHPGARKNGRPGTLRELMRRGVIAAFEWRWPRPSEPLFIHTHASVYAAPDASHGGAPGTILAGGTALDAEVAFIKGQAEAVERYCASRTDRLEVFYATAEELGENAVGPDEFDLFQTDQRTHRNFPYIETNRSAPLTWVKATDLEGNAGWIPRAMVEMYSSDLSFESAPVSGYACGSQLQDAMVSGLLEVMERDALMTSWRLNRETVDRSEEVLHDEEVRRSLARFHPVEGRVSCHDLSNDLGYPVVLAKFESERDQPSVVIATACAMTLEMAAAKAIEELAANLILLREHLAAGTAIPARAEEVRTMEDHGLFYCDRTRHSALKRLAGCRSAKDEPKRSRGTALDRSEMLAGCAGKLKEAGLKAWVVNLTRPEVEDLGFHVVKVVVPGAYPIEFGWDHPRLGGNRLGKLAERWGVPLPKRPEQFNLAPHPFP